MKSSKSREIIICKHPRVWDFFGRSEVPKEDLKLVKLPLPKDSFCQKCGRCFSLEDDDAGNVRKKEKSKGKKRNSAEKGRVEKNTVCCPHSKVCGNGEAVEISVSGLKFLNLPNIEDPKCLECRKCPKVGFLLLLREKKNQIEDIFYYCPTSGEVVKFFKSSDDPSEPQKCPSCGQGKKECSFAPTKVTAPLVE